MASSLAFKVKRQEPILVAPAKPTPREFKALSGIDDQDMLRIQLTFINFYRNDGSMGGRDPVSVVREALAEALVLYYPIAGRLRERPGRTLVVECTGEGVLFVEADAKVRLEQFGDALQPPFPCFDELLYDVPCSSDIVNCPLLLFQVTRLACGGFILAYRMSHIMCDGQGLIQFLNAVGEITRGALAPSVTPVWGRDHQLLKARNPPQVTHMHHEYDQIAYKDGKDILNITDIAHNSSVFISPSDISAIRAHIPPHLRSSSTTFEVISACLWRCRTIALGLDPDEVVKFICVFNIRNCKEPPLPDGYYGNGIFLPTAVAQAGELCKSSLVYALELVKKAKDKMSKEYVQSALDFIVLNRSQPLVLSDLRNFVLSDLRRVGFMDIDLGWGRPVYAGPAKGGPGVISFSIPYKDGIVVPFLLPPPVMESFSKELRNFIADGSKILASS